MGISQSKRKREKFANYSFEHNQSLQTRSATTSSRKFHHSTTATHSSDKIRGARPSSSPPQRQNSDTRVGAGKGELYAGVESNSQFLPQNTDYEAFDFNLHFALRKLFDGNVISTVLPKLKPNAVVVDIGCRNGAWIMDMATQFPTCKYIGVRAIGDEAPLDADALKLPNAKFEDIIDNSRLPTLQDNSVDVVHMRVQFLVLTRSQWKMILKEAYRILKPGGVMQASELLYAVGGTVMVESFLETVRNVLNSVDRDLEVALKLPTLLSDAGFQIIQSMRRDVHYTSDGHLAQEFVKINLQAFQRRQELLAPRMGLDPEEYAQRAEMVCAQCVQADAHLEWYVHVGKKPSSSTLATSANPP